MKHPVWIVLLSGLAAAPLAPAAAQDLLWTRQAGTTAEDGGHGVTVDGAGNVYTTGQTGGSLFGPGAGGADCFLARYDASGAQLWARQFGTPQNDLARGVGVDDAGNVYLTGDTNGDLGGPIAGARDIVLAKYDASGTLLWMRQTGTSTVEFGLGLAVDGPGNTSITGWTAGDFGGTSAGGFDAILARYDASGTLLWTRQAGSPADDFARAVAADGAGNAYITGETGGSLGGPGAGLDDAFLAKYDAAGALLWTRQLGTSTNDIGTGVAVDGAGNAYLTGYTDGSLAGPSAGDTDIFLAKFDSSGTLLWTRQVGSPAGDFARAAAVDGAGNAYIAGDTSGGLGGPSAGGNDIFLAKYGPAPCYPNCDNSSIAPILNVADFICFINKYASADPYANCDASTTPPVLNVNDFICFQTGFAAGCP